MMSTESKLNEKIGIENVDKINRSLRLLLLLLLMLLLLLLLFYWRSNKYFNEI